MGILKILSALIWYNNLGLLASCLARRVNFFYRYRWFITGKCFVKTCRKRISMYQDLLLGPWTSWLARWNNFCQYRQLTGIWYFVKACSTKVILIIKIYKIRPADKMARLESRFFVNIDNSFKVNILLSHVEEKLFSLLASITRYQELGRQASWLARRADFVLISLSCFWIKYYLDMQNNLN